MEKVSVSIIVKGIVQGVGFRYFTVNEAKKLGICGYVKNEPDGSVFAYAEGGKMELQEFVESLKRGPRYGSVTGVSVEWGEYNGNYKRFNIEY